MVFFVNVELLRDLLNLGYGDFAGLIKAVRNFERVDSLVEQLLGLVENGAGKDYNTGSSISNFVVLTGRELSEEFRGLMVNLQKKT